MNTIYLNVDGKIYLFDTPMVSFIVLWIIFLTTMYVAERMERKEKENAESRKETSTNAARKKTVKDHEHEETVPVDLEK